MVNGPDGDRRSPGQRPDQVKTSKAPRSHLDDAVQVADLLAAAGELDGEARADRRHVPRRALIATLAFTGLRIGELLALQWRHIDLAGGRLRVEDAKTAAGIRHVTLQPVLRDELLALRADASTTSPSAPVFATARGHAMSVDNVRSRVFGAAVNRANERRQEGGQPPLPANLTPHSLRRTYISALLALGWEVPGSAARPQRQVCREGPRDRDTSCGSCPMSQHGPGGQYLLGPGTRLRPSAVTTAK